MKLRQHFCAAFLLVIVSSTASAAVTLYQGGGDHANTIDEARDSFLAVTPTTVENFDAGITPGTSIDFPVGGTTEFTATSTSGLSENTNYAISGDYTLYNCGNTGHSVTFDFVSPISAFGVDIRDVADGGNILSFSLNTGDSGTATTLFNTYHHEFFGITSTVPFSSITFTWSAGTDCVYWEDLRYGSSFAPPAPASPVPSLGTWSLVALSMLLGLFGMGAFVHRRSQ